MLASTAFAQFPPQIRNVIVIVQENRTPDNLFHFLTPQCPIPAGATGLDACTPYPVTASCYNISPCGLSNQHGNPVPITLQPRSMQVNGDPGHLYLAFQDMCDANGITHVCRNDEAWLLSYPYGLSYSYASNPTALNSDGTWGHFLDPYLTLAKQYGWANYMFQTNQGPSFPAHQFLFGGTSALSAADDAKSTFQAENDTGPEGDGSSGCLALSKDGTQIVSPALNTPPPGCKTYVGGSVQECKLANTELIYPTHPVGSFCATHKSMGDELDAQGLRWKYYVPTAGYIWTAPDAIKSICQPQWVNPNADPTSQLECTGAIWNAHVDLGNLGTNILRDIASCDLPRVSWVVPNGEWSDHPNENGIALGPSWVATVVNAIGNNPKCPKGTTDAAQTYWQNTAIVITWDDWGGWSDHEIPPMASPLPCKSMDCQGDYQFGFRVPMIVVSAYTPAGLIDNQIHDFGSILRMLEAIVGQPEGELGFADKRATTDLSNFFTLPKPRPYVTIPTPKNAKFFLQYIGPATAPDND